MSEFGKRRIEVFEPEPTLKRVPEFVWAICALFLIVPLVFVLAWEQRTEVSAAGTFAQARAQNAPALPPLPGNVLSRTTTAVAGTIDIPSEQSGQHAALCQEQWTKRGVLDDRMYNYCLDQEHEGYLNLLDQTNHHGGLPWFQAAVNAAVKKWTKRDMRSDRMVAYEINQQIDAFLDMKYSEKKSDFNKSVADQCISEWTKDFQNWEMIKYCYTEQVKPLP